MKAVAATLKKEADLPLYVVGTSASAWRLAVFGPRLNSEVGVSGLVLTASTFWPPELLQQRAQQLRVARARRASPGWGHRGVA